ncbi:RNA-directed DNA polymerase (reverse transcriptase) [Trifolium pratense]|uniref:RNA-directed DNA polymerase (Reverse transcriptase) n=1 Tax=Trifolium pratense TaxID=57577 RepID=A0A2K3L0L9_TRIPR|nr:RNA-directed DNA polymerase (reverse transcriptase) [Trifolium pratense]
MLNFMDKCNLVDFGMTGGSFTWNRPCTGNHMIFRKLDRTLVDVPWRMSFPDAYVEVLYPSVLRQLGSLTQTTLILFKRLGENQLTTLLHVFTMSNKTLFVFTRKLLRELQQEYDTIHGQEEIHLYQKVRDDWIKLGDCNTKFFHTKTIIRRKRNRIHGLHLSNATLSLGELNDLSLAPALNEEERQSLCSQVTREKVTQALNQMHPFKAPGHDGF